MYKITIWHLNSGDSSSELIETIDKAERRLTKLQKDPLIMEAYVEEATEEDYYLDALPEGYIEVEN